MTARRSMSVLSVLLTLTFLLSASAWADSNVRIVRLSLVDGPVQLDRATGEGFERAIMNTAPRSASPPVASLNFRSWCSVPTAHVTRSCASIRDART